jgi:hypothetical protein
MKKNQTPGYPGSGSPPPAHDGGAPLIGPTDERAHPGASLSPAEAAVPDQEGSLDQQSQADLHSALLATDSFANELEETLVGLVSSTDLFDVPAMDFSDLDAG